MNKYKDTACIMVLLPTSQNKEGGTGACMTICLNVARYFCRLDCNKSISTKHICKLIKHGSLDWIKNSGKFQTGDEVIKNNPQLSMEIITSQINSMGFNDKYKINIENLKSKYNQICNLTKTKICAILLSNTYSYLFTIRNGYDIIFDSHGDKSKIIFFNNSDKVFFTFLKQELSLNATDYFDVIWLKQK